MKHPFVDLAGGSHGRPPTSHRRVRRWRAALVNVPYRPATITGPLSDPPVEATLHAGTSTASRCRHGASPSESAGTRACELRRSTRAVWTIGCDMVRSRPRARNHARLSHHRDLAGRLNVPVATATATIAALEQEIEILSGRPRCLVRASPVCSPARRWSAPQRSNPSPERVPRASVRPAALSPDSVPRSSTLLELEQRSSTRLGAPPG